MSVAEVEAVDMRARETSEPSDPDDNGSVYGSADSRVSILGVVYRHENSH